MEEIWSDFRIWSNGTGLFSQNRKNHVSRRREDNRI